ncbi:hypothetical protein BKA69DRAFT_1129065 [Paraphysoderma sedebokerense]|nr:hypothetical protein BKA69DRAFT_1129065 [Paraphysoderma sedebokerense]
MSTSSRSSSKSSKSENPYVKERSKLSKRFQLTTDLLKWEKEAAAGRERFQSEYRAHIDSLPRSFGIGVTPSPSPSPPSTPTTTAPSSGTSATGSSPSNTIEDAVEMLKVQDVPTVTGEEAQVVDVPKESSSSGSTNDSKAVSASSRFYSNDIFTPASTPSPKKRGTYEKIPGGEPFSLKFDPKVRDPLTLLNATESKQTKYLSPEKRVKRPPSNKALETNSGIGAKLAMNWGYTEK